MVLVEWGFFGKCIKKRSGFMELILSVMRD